MSKWVYDCIESSLIIFDIYIRVSQVQNKLTEEFDVEATNCLNTWLRSWCLNSWQFANDHKNDLYDFDLWVVCVFAKGIIIGSGLL